MGGWDGKVVFPFGDNRMRSTITLPLLASLAGALPLAAGAAGNANELRAAGLAATCANCHGTAGRAIEGSVVPGLAGQPAAFLAEQLKGFKDGSRPATVMHQIAKGYTDAQINTMAAWFAAQKR
jgi:cytochrome c553